MGNNRTVLLIVVCCILFATNIDTKLLVYLNKVDILNNLKYSNASVTIHQYGPGMKRTVADFRLEVFQTIPDVMVSTIYYVPSMDGSYNQAFYNRTINFCTYLRQPHTDRVLKIVYGYLNKQGKLPARCPIAPGTYSFNTSFDGVHLPGFLPESSFRFDLSFQRYRPRNELFFYGHWFGEIHRVP